MLQGFDPIIGESPTVLILGSMPSVTSLEKHEYYGFRYNRFWKFMSEYFEEKLSCYEDKKHLIQKHHMILWDVIGSCEREGSLDAMIKHEQVNDISGIVDKYKSLRYVICNGKKAYDLYNRHFIELPIICISLPSTSNANRTITKEQLYKAWKDAFDEIFNGKGDSHVVGK